MFLPRLFCFHKPSINFNAEAGGVVGKKKIIMLNNKEIAYAIGTFIDKYGSDSSKVTWPEDVLFKVESAVNIDVMEESVKELKTGLWKFEASANVTSQEKEGPKIRMTAQKTFKGYAKIEEIINNVKQAIPNVEQVSVVELI